jgi:hypothetical protein
MKFLTICGLMTTFLFGFDYSNDEDVVARPTHAVKFSTNVFKSTAGTKITPIKLPNNICIVDTDDDTYTFETHVVSCIKKQPNWLRVRMNGAETP